MGEMREGVRYAASLQSVLFKHPGVDQHQWSDTPHDVPRVDHQIKANFGHHQSFSLL